MDRRDARTDRGQPERRDQVIRPDAWTAIEAAAGVTLDELAREHVHLLIYLASKKALAAVSNEPLDQGQRAKFLVVAEAAEKLQEALSDLKAHWLERRLLDASEGVRAERRLNHSEQGQFRSTFLTELVNEPTMLTHDILRDVAVEVALAARRVLDAREPGEKKRVRGQDKKLLERRLKGMLQTLKRRNVSRAQLTRFTDALWWALPAGHPVRHLLRKTRET